MSRSRDLMVSRAVVAVAACILAGCGEAPQEATPVEPALARVPVSVSAVLTCPLAVESAVRAQVGPEGGVVSVQGHTIYFPPGAVPEPVNVTLTVPASRHVELDIQVNGQEHYELARPVLATLSYERCGPALVRGGTLTVWHVDAANRRLLEPMSSLHDRKGRTVSFVSNHFSRYVLVNN